MSLPEPDLRLLRLFSAAVLGRFDELAELRRNAPPGEPDRRWREALLQVHVFAGIPRGVEAYAVLEAQGGLGSCAGEEETLDAAQRLARGEAFFRRIYEQDSRAVRGMLERQHPDFARWVLLHAYGSVLTRPGLDARLRELLAVCALAALGQERQLASHVRGARRCGATHEEIAEALAVLVGLAEPERLERARRVFERYAAS